jgi:hypothetical protein
LGGDNDRAYVYRETDDLSGRKIDSQFYDDVTASERSDVAYSDSSVCELYWWLEGKSGPACAALRRLSKDRSKVERRRHVGERQ